MQQPILDLRPTGIWPLRRDPSFTAPVIRPRRAPLATAGGRQWSL